MPDIWASDAAAIEADDVGQRMLARLNKREIEIAGCLADGMTKPEIAARYGISAHTVDSYTRLIYDKWGCSDRTTLAVCVHRHAALRTQLPMPSLSEDWEPRPLPEEKPRPEPRVVLHVVGEDPSAVDDDAGKRLWLALSEQRRTVAGLVADGLSNRQIAARLRIAENTVKKHVNAVGKAWGKRSRLEIAVAVYRSPLLRASLPRHG